MRSLLRSCLSVVLAVVAAGAFSAPAAAALPPGGTFIDDNGLSFEPAIEAVAAAGITRGCGGGRFCPSDAGHPRPDGGLPRSAPSTSPRPAASRFVDVPPATRSALPSTPRDGRHHRRLRCRPLLPVRPRHARPDGRLPAARPRPDRDERHHVHRCARQPPVRDCHQRLATAGITSAAAAAASARPTGHAAARWRRSCSAPSTWSPINPPPPSAGNPTGHAPIPARPRLADTVRTPTASSARARRPAARRQAVVSAVARGGVITVRLRRRARSTITMSATAKVFNDRPERRHRRRRPRHARRRRRAADPLHEHLRPDLVWTTSHCQNQDHPTLTVQNITLRERPLDRQRDAWMAAAPSSSAAAAFKVVNSALLRQPMRADRAGRRRRRAPGVLAVRGPAGLRREQHVRRRRRASATRARTAAASPASASRGPSSTACSRDNRAIGSGANPPKAGTPGGGNGGAIYNDGNDDDAAPRRHADRGQHAPTARAAAPSSSSATTAPGTVRIEDSVIRDNTGDGFSTHPSIFFLGRTITFIGSVVE